MNRLAVVTFLAVGTLLAACGGSAATASPTSGGSTATGTPGGATPLVTPSPSGPLPATPTFGGTNEPPIGGVCAGLPTANPNNPLQTPTIVPDPALEAHFPAQIDGSPADGLQSSLLAEYWCYYDAQGIGQLQGGPGLDLAKVTTGQADYTVDDNDITLLAFRNPGGDGNAIAALLSQLVVLSGNAEDLGQVSQGTVGGKNVYIVTHPDGTKDYGYVSGDTMITAGDLTDSQAQKVFSALQ